MGLTVLAVVVQILALIIWPVLDDNGNTGNDIDIVWALPVGLLLASFGWWECYVEESGLTRYSNFISVVKY